MYNDQIINTLEKLAELHKKGILTDEEFQSQKSRILAQISTAELNAASDAGVHTVRNTEYLSPRDAITVPSIYVWLLAFSSVIVGIITKSIDAILQISSPINYFGLMLFVSAAVIIPLYISDKAALQERAIDTGEDRSGYLIGFIFLGLLFVPAYLNRRRHLIKNTTAPFWVATVFAIINVLAILLLSLTWVPEWISPS